MTEHIHDLPRSKRDEIYKWSLANTNNENPLAVDPTQPHDRQRFDATNPGHWWPIEPRSIASLSNLYPPSLFTRPGAGSYRGYQVEIVQPSAFQFDMPCIVEETKKIYYGQGVVLDVRDIDRNFIHAWERNSAIDIKRYLKVVYLKVYARATVLQSVSQDSEVPKSGACDACAATDSYQYHDVHWQQPMFEIKVSGENAQELTVHARAQLATRFQLEFEKRIHHWYLRSWVVADRFIGQDLLAVVQVLWKLLCDTKFVDDATCSFSVREGEIVRYDGREERPPNWRVCPNVVVVKDGYTWPVAQIQCGRRGSLETTVKPMEKEEEGKMLEG